MSLRRRRLLLWSALPALLALALAAKLMGAAWFGGQAAEAYARNDAAATGAAASALAFANFLEPHKAPFAAGDALALRGDYAGARAAFEAALATAPPADECHVRVNLALSIERLGDASAGSTPDGLRLFEEAQAVARSAPAGCRGADSSQPDISQPDISQPGERLREAEQRLADKIERLRNQAPPGTEPDADPGADGSAGTEPPASERQRQLDQLKQSGTSAQQERNRGLQREDYLNSSSGAATDKPW